MQDELELFNNLVYTGGGYFRDGRIPKGEKAICLHGKEVLELAKKLIEFNKPK